MRFPSVSHSAGCLQIGEWLDRHRDDADRTAAALERLNLPRVINKNTPHRHRRDPEEVRAVRPGRLPGPDELDVRLVHEGGRLQRLPGRQPGEPMRPGH